LPDEVYFDATFSAFYWSSVDMACIANVSIYEHSPTNWLNRESQDVYSFAAEQAAGLADHNLLTVLMRSQKLTLQGASDAAGAHYAMLMDEYMAARAILLQRTGQPDVDAFVRAMDYWPVGNVVWSLETGRYFGMVEAERERVRKTRLVRLSVSAIETGEDSDGTNGSTEA